MTILLTPWESGFLQQCVSRWHQYKAHGPANFSDVEYILIQSIRTKVQVPDGTPLDLTTEENELLQSLFRMGKDFYGMPGGDLDYAARLQVRLRSVYVSDSILAKLRGNPQPQSPNEVDQGQAVD